MAQVLHSVQGLLLEQLHVLMHFALGRFLAPAEASVCTHVFRAACQACSFLVEGRVDQILLRSAVLVEHHAGGALTHGIVLLADRG